MHTSIDIGIDKVWECDEWKCLNKREVERGGTGITMQRLQLYNNRKENAHYGERR